MKITRRHIPQFKVKPSEKSGSEAQAHLAVGYYSTEFHVLSTIKRLAESSLGGYVKCSRFQAGQLQAQRTAHAHSENARTLA